MSAYLRFFKREAWLGAVQSCYANRQREFFELEYQTNSAGGRAIPLVSEMAQVDGVGPVHVCRFAGVFASDYADFRGVDSLCIGDLRRIAIELQQRDIDVVWLSHIVRGSRLGGFERAKGEVPGRWSRVEAVGSQVVGCAGSYDAYLARLSRNTRRNVRRKVNALAAKGAEFAARPATVDSIENFLQLQKLRADAAQHGAYSEDRELSCFLRALVDVPGVKSMTLEARGELVASSIVLEDGLGWGVYLEAHDPRWGPYSPGFCLTARVIEAAHDAGVQFVDFLRGREPHKLHFMPTHLQTVKVVGVLRSDISLDAVRAHVEQTIE